MDKLDHKDHFINRELSWLAFNERVMAEAQDEQTQLLERLKFIAIFCSNLDEFFMVRVAGLKDKIKSGDNRADDKSALTPKQQLQEISTRVHADVQLLYDLLLESLIPRLRQEGLYLRTTAELSEIQKEYLAAYYDEKIFPVLTPLAVDASHPFPFLFNKSLNLAVFLEPEDEERDTLFAIVQVPTVLPRYIPLPSTLDGDEFILLEDVIREHIETLFPGNHVIEAGYFRVTRDSDVEFDEDTNEDLLEQIENELKKRKMGDAVRLEIHHSMSESLRRVLQESLDLTHSDVYSLNGPLDLTFFMSFYSTPGYDELRYPHMVPQPPKDLLGESQIFDAIVKKDLMVFHPYESFEPVVHFVSQAAEDPNVLAIKQTLYRVSGQSPIVNALVRAADNGKQVTVVLELKARFDEENNIIWAKKLEKAGCHVIYGLVGLKTHAKITLIVRREAEQIRRYVHLGTGNYNDTTARMYSDLGMFTAREEFGRDASAFFNHLTGYGTTPQWERISISPLGIQEKLLEMVEREIQQSTPENPGRIIAKMNSLTSKEMIVALFRASQAHVKVDLIVRGICCLRPGIPGISENIRVHSIVGRFLEHSRIFYFQNGGDEQVLLSSADWMTRNLRYRVELMFPVVQKNLRDRVKRILDAQLNDNVKRSELLADGHYVRAYVKDDEVPLNSQNYFLEEAQRATRRYSFSQLTPKTHA
ncbi:RNA degradosome polyphosphate kinase [Alicyclobacillus tolerans]|uniref:RNA degradosome polyphosphate kinase n=1 Tax=Alicyclobacillus tolerans TaxID=90970 RepID=UPI001F02C04A|nr:RNA degradosome polyphosphate kinase [Alicyclobacillus tolerans]MCF8566577.1 RNA degradosome polyphosphate kinase [Alicyclobacillus tolerans]